ncbi:TPA: Tn3 family transposase, partial [Klebsiella quasipneumoniae]|nr:Tn3 family transposase [Klebsiella quasipneumoniae]
NAHTGFADEFFHASEASARVDDLPVSISAVLMAEACNIGLEPLIRSRHSLRLWQSRERNCRAMCNGNLKNFSNAGGWSMAFYGFAASLATPSTWSLSAVSVAVSARAVGRGGWPKVPPCWLMKYCLNNPCVSGC